MKLGKPTICDWDRVALQLSVVGILPVYWKSIISVPSDQIIAHRVLWCFLFLLVLFLQAGSGLYTKYGRRPNNSRTIYSLYYQY